MPHEPVNVVPSALGQLTPEEPEPNDPGPEPPTSDVGAGVHWQAYGLPYIVVVVVTV